MKKVIYSNQDITENYSDKEVLFTLEDIGVILSGIKELKGLDIEVSDLGNGKCEIRVGDLRYTYWDVIK